MLDRAADMLAALAACGWTRTKIYFFPLYHENKKKTPAARARGLNPSKMNIKTLTNQFDVGASVADFA